MREGSCEDGRGSDAVEEEDEGSETSNDDDYEPRGSESSWSSESIARNASDHSLDFGDSDDDREGTEGLVDPAAPNVGKKKIIGGFGDEDPGYNSEDFLDILLSEDEEDMGKRFPIHRPLKNMSEYKWEVGTLYVSREEFKDCATAYAVSSGRGLRFSKVDLRRVKVECVEGCEWYAYCGKLKHERSWQLKSCNNKHNKHNCSRELKIGIMHAKWLSKVFLNKIAENPKIKLTTLMRKAYTKWNVELTKSKASRTNPGSSVHLKVQRPPEFASERPVPGVDLRPRFERVYVMLDACRRSFMACRPMIGLDGCFLKIPYGGWLLIAMGWDPNDQILPIAYAVFEAETKDSWTWFLQHLCNDLGVDKIRTCTFMSDQQKGLVPTFEELLPGVDHRFCVRHLYANFKKRYTGIQLKLMMWNAAKATYYQEWERRMTEIQKVDPGAYNYLMEIPTKYWCRHRFVCRPRCDTLVNNMCEVFNSILVEAREKPIVTMLEKIRVYIMKRCADNRDRIMPYNRDVLPRIRIKVEKQAELSWNWVSVYAGRDRYEVVSIQGGRKNLWWILGIMSARVGSSNCLGFPVHMR
ncbi:uncharacterized protein LOC107464691 [Arachis duranensis]|uniref:Uncharacterized protein LOC107464691 n=1 Tax=Arachis duranensis TaxID=130453 RepID=A0A9C6T572_ARADU|nr:uncharacterized protein LOC107464691 [Arachis duranensis]